MKKWLRFLNKISLLGAGAFLILGLSAFAYPNFWFADNMSFFLRQLALGAFGGVLFCLCTSLSGLHRSRLGFKVSIAILLGLVVLALLTGARTYHLASKAVRTSHPNLKLVSINIEGLDLSNQTLTDYLAEENADIILFQETFWWLQNRYLSERGLKTVAGLPPYPANLVKGELGETTVFSKFPVTAVEYVRVPGSNPTVLHSAREIIILDIETAAGPIQLFAVHPNSPRTPSRWRDRQRYLSKLQEAIARRKAASPAPIIVMGDWNTSPWSGNFAAFMETTGFATAFPNDIPQTTRFFYDYRLHWLLGAIVDHIAISPEVLVGRVELGPDVGSDHLPLSVDLELFPQAQRIVE